MILQNGDFNGMSSQKDIFLKAEADQWYSRNVNHSNKNHRLYLEVINNLELKPERLLEVGCSSGYNLDLIQKEMGVKCYGVDPSKKAIRDGKSMFPELSLQVGTADALNFPNNSIDVIILGFCLYLCDRKDLFKIAYEVDRCLNDNGFIIVNDFYPNSAYKNIYKHCEGMYSYKMKYSEMFSWNPEYQCLYHNVYTHDGLDNRNDPNEKVGLTVLQKCEKFAYPLILTFEEK